MTIRVPMRKCKECGAKITFGNYCAECIRKLKQI